MTLAEYMAERGLSDEEMAERIGCSSFAVKKWRYRERTPRGAAMRRIKEATGGEVTADDFLPAEGEAA